MEVGSKFQPMDVKVTWRIEVLSIVDNNSKSMDVNAQITKVTWRIENFSSIKDEKLYSEYFNTVDGNKWRIFIYPKGNNVDYLSISLQVADSATLPSGWSRYAQVGFTVIDQIDRKNSHTKVTCVREFKPNGFSSWGFPSFLAIGELHNPGSGYLVNDSCLIEVYVSTDRTEGLISHELIVKVDSDKYKFKEADCVEANKHDESNEIMAIEPGETFEEEMKTLLTRLESEFSSSCILYSQEEAKKALAKLHEALNMTPANFYDLVNFSSLEKMFKILGSFDCSSTMLTVQEKNELLAIEESLTELACRATKAVQDKNLLVAKKSIKLSVTRNLECNLIRFKQMKQKLGVLHEQDEEAQKNRHDMMVEQKKIFESFGKMKIELETLGKEWAEYEANAKAAEEEEKNVEMEWRRIKDFIYVIKRKI